MLTSVIYLVTVNVLSDTLEPEIVVATFLYELTEIVRLAIMRDKEYLDN